MSSALTFLCPLTPITPSALRVPSSPIVPSGANLPLVFVEMDLEDNMDIFGANRITSAPSIIVYPPSLTEAPLKLSNFVADAPAHHKYVYSPTSISHSHATSLCISPCDYVLCMLHMLIIPPSPPHRRPTTSFGFSTGDFLTFLQTFMRDDTAGPQQSLTAMQSASNPLVEALSALPVAAWIGMSSLLVIAASLALKHAAALVAVVSWFKPVIALLAMAFYAFNSAGGLFGKVSGKPLELWPPQLVNALSVQQLALHVER